MQNRFWLFGSNKCKLLLVRVEGCEKGLSSWLSRQLILLKISVWKEVTVQPGFLWKQVYMIIHHVCLYPL